MEAIGIRMGLILLYMLSNCQQQNIQHDYVVVQTGERVTLVGEFDLYKGSVIICDKKDFSKCGHKNKQKVILWSLNQILIELDTSPYRIGKTIYIYVLNRYDKVLASKQTYIGYLAERRFQLN
jgi:hypothetical protein